MHALTDNTGPLFSTALIIFELIFLSHDCRTHALAASIISGGDEKYEAFFTLLFIDGPFLSPLPPLPRPIVSRDFLLPSPILLISRATT